MERAKNECERMNVGPTLKIYTKLVNEVKSEIQMEIAERTLYERGGQEMAIYTDESAESGWRNGCAACVTRWNERDIVRRIASGKMSSSFGAEALAMREAMRVNECERPNSVIICTDS